MTRFACNFIALDRMDTSVANHTPDENLTFFANRIEKHLADWRGGSHPATSLGMVRQYAHWMFVLATWQRPGEFVPSDHLLDPGEGEG